ncbi:MAG: cell division protein FtsA [Bacilli bacterium]|nr:cell division protein FtsA [Bacilli bacterium]
MRKIYSAVDIGSSFIKIVVLEDFNNKLNVLSSICFPSDGVKNGLVIDDARLVNSIKSAFNEINKSLGVKVDKVIASVPTNNAKYTLNSGYTTITSTDKAITSEDILNALQASVYNKIDETMELVTVMPIKYIVDDKAEVKNPRGICAEKLSVYSMTVTAPKKNIYKIVGALSQAGLEVVDILFNSIGDYYAFKEKDFDENVVGVINIGSDKTELTTFNNGIITNSTLIQDGSSLIEGDISYVYNISSEKAKKIKEMFLVLDKNYASKSEVYETKDNSNMKVKINQYEVSEIAENKLKEILEKAKKELNYLTKKEIRYIIISGGIGNIPGFDSICFEVFGEQTKVKPINIIGIRNLSYSSSYGMVKYFINKLNLRGRSYTMFNEEKQYKLIENRKNEDNTNSFKIGKLFGRFFDNKEE